MRKYTLRQRARYAFDNTMSRGTSALVAWLALATFGLVILFTLLTPSDRSSTACCTRSTRGRSGATPAAGSSY
jgi:hypothetical protein